MKPRTIFFWIHLGLGIAIGLVGALMAGTAVIMAFADSFLDVRDYRVRRVDPPANAKPQSLEALAERVNAKHPGTPVNRVGFGRDPNHACEFYYDKDGLEYVDRYSGELRPSDSVPLRRSLHKGVEQWHRFLGMAGDRRATGKFLASWFNAALIPLFLTGLVLWWPRHLRWRAVRAALTPAGNGRGLGSERSWHSAIGFWTLPLLLIMVVTGTSHSFKWVQDMGYRLTGNPAVKLERSDSLWAPGLLPRPIQANTSLLTLDELLDIANRELPSWTRLDIFHAPPPKPGNRTDSARLLAKAPGWGPSFFPIIVQVDPYSGGILDVHSWADLSAGTRLFAWSRWLHKGEAFGRFGQIVAGLACLLMLVLIYSGWALAIRRLVRSRKKGGPKTEQALS